MLPFVRRIRLTWPALAGTVALTLAATSCGEDTGGQHGGGGSSPTTTATTTTTTSECVSSPGYAVPIDPPAASVLFVTSEAMRPSFERFCTLHDVTGIPCRVVTVEQICPGGCDDADPRSDTAHAIKAYLQEQPAGGTVVLGGDIEIVPSRLVHDSYQNPFMPSYVYDESFYTDYYYSDLSEWDANGDGAYAEDGVDAPDYRPELAVARIVVSTPDEAEAYRQKVIRYLTAFPAADVPKAVLMSNVATQLVGLDVDGALYLESAGRTASLLPQGFAVRKLYATLQADPAAEICTPALQTEAIEQGTNLVVHSGHAGVDLLNVEYDGSKEFTGTMAHDLQNATLPIYLSCGCEAGSFAAPYGSYTSDAAGELLMNAPNGGAIAYLGNGVIGLGLAGGMQLIDELLRYAQATDAPLLADAYRIAHQQLPDSDSLSFLGIPVPTINRDSYEWTQKAVVLFGDPLIPIYKAALEPGPALSLGSEPLCEGVRIDVTIEPSEPGLLRLEAAGAVYELAGAAGAVQVDLAGQPSSVAVGLLVPGHEPAYAELAL